MSYIPVSPSTALSKQILVDFGGTGVTEKTFTVADPSVTASSKLTGNVAYVATADHPLDEIQFDAFDLKFAPGAGSFSLYMRALVGTVGGKYLVDYTVSAG